MYKHVHVVHVAKTQTQESTAFTTELHVLELLVIRAKSVSITSVQTESIPIPVSLG